jgi:hypothetical protein
VSARRFCERGCQGIDPGNPTRFSSTLTDFRGETIRRLQRRPTYIPEWPTIPQARSALERMALLQRITETIVLSNLSELNRPVLPEW